MYITDEGREGTFILDPNDKNSTDDSSMVLVMEDGRRFKRLVDQGTLNVKWFGATGDGTADDWYAIQKGINYIINNPSSVRTLYFPPGNYKISRPLIIARLVGRAYYQASINLAGPANSKNLAVGAAQLLPSFNNTFAIGIQTGKGIQIKDLILRGKFTFPDKLSHVQVDTLSFDEWTDGQTRNNTQSPYSGIVIDPFSDSTLYKDKNDMYPGLHRYYQPGIGRGGSTSVQITGCSIRNFIVGVMITPSWQQNGELIDVIDCNISSNKVAYAMGQAQSKECHVQRLMCWSQTHTVFDNTTYGIHQADGAAVPMVDGVNIAGSVKQLCNINAPSFGGSFRNVYAEELWRIGYINGASTISFENCQFDFSTYGPGIPYPDFFVQGSGASFHGCMLRHYTGGRGMRLILSGARNSYEGGNMNEPPVTTSLNNCNSCPTSLFNNVVMYYSGGILGNNSWGITTPTRAFEGLDQDPLYYGNHYLLEDPLSGMSLLYKFTYQTGYERVVKISGTRSIHVDKSKWTAYFKLMNPADTTLLRPGDFLLTYNLPYQDQFRNITGFAYPVGFVESIDHDIVHLRNLAHGIQEGMELPLWTDYYLYVKAPLTGSLEQGSRTLKNAQGAFPAVGERLDIPMLPGGTYVTAVDRAAKTVTFSNPNNTGRSYSDCTFINGYPAIEMHSAYPLPDLQKHGKTLIGSADFYLHDVPDKNMRDPAYLLGPGTLSQYRVLNTNILGDTSLHRLKYSQTAGH